MTKSETNVLATRMNTVQNCMCICSRYSQLFSFSFSWRTNQTASI